MLRPAPDDFGLSSVAAGRVQLNVDDPAVSCLGSPSEIDLAVDLVILRWSALGIPLALGKGSRETGQHKWIGGLFSLRAGRQGPEAIVNVPPLFATELADMLRPFTKGEGHQAENSTERMLGKAGRLAYIVPTARPFFTSLWGALAGARAARQRGKTRSAARQSASTKIQNSSGVASDFARAA